MLDTTYSIIIGIILGVIIFFICRPKHYRGPNSADIKNKIFTLNNKCFMLKPLVHVCPGGKLKKFIK